MNEGSDRTPLTRDSFDRSVLDAAPGLPGRTLVRHSEGTIEVPFAEVEAYTGDAALMAGPPGHTYVCFAYGMSSRSA